MTSYVANLAFSCVLAVAVGSRVQSTEFPLVLQSEHRPPLTSADQFHLAKDADQEVQCFLTYQNDELEKTVELRWYGKKGDARAYASQAVETEYFPTAVTVGAGLTNRFFVAGASPSAGTMVIEEWTLGPALFESPAVDAASEDDEPRLDLVLPSITRTVLYSASTAVTQEVIAMGFHGAGNQLLFLEHARRSLHALFLNAPGSSPVLVADANTLPFLRNVRSMQSNMHETDGFVVFFFRHPTWAWECVATELGILRDANRDGELEIGAAAWITMAQLDETFPTGGWIEAYP